MSDATRPGMITNRFVKLAKAHVDRAASLPRQRTTPAAIDRVEPNGSREGIPGSKRSFSDFEMQNQTGEQGRADGRADKSPPASTWPEQNTAAKEKLEDDEQEALIAFGIAVHCTAKAQEMDLKQVNIPKLVKNMAK